MKPPSGPEPGLSASVMFASPVDTLGETRWTNSCVTMTSCRPGSMARRARAHEPASRGSPFRPAEARARTASDARSSGEYLFGCFIAPVSQGLEPPGNPVRFSRGAMLVAGAGAVAWLVWPDTARLVAWRRGRRSERARRRYVRAIERATRTTSRAERARGRANRRPGNGRLGPNSDPVAWAPGNRYGPHATKDLLRRLR